MLDKQEKKTIIEEKEGSDRMKQGKYRRREVHQVVGRQGIAVWGDGYIVSGSATLTRYDAQWNAVAHTDAPFAVGFPQPVNHIGDIDVFGGEIFCGAELFLDGVAKNIQIAVYDAETLVFKRAFPFAPESGQTECSGITVNGDDRTVWMSSWADGESGRYLYQYDLNTGKYLRRVHLHAVPQWIQGVAYHDGAFYLTADDGDADFDEPDHIYRAEILPGATHCKVTEEKTLDDVIKQGEIEGLAFADDPARLLVLYNRGMRIVLGMPTAPYPGYTQEIHEVFVYDVT